MNQLRNLITDIPGLRVGNAEDAALGSGVTVALFDEPAVVSFFAMGGAPATRETDLLDPDKMVPGIHGVVLSGGSAFGLDAASGVQAFLRERGIGFAVRDALVPLVSQASSFDLVNGGNKNWGRYPPYRELGYEAALNAGLDFALGTAGGGYGATTANLKGGLGSTSAVTSAGHAVGALVVVNSVSSAVIGNGPHFWAGALEENEEFGGHGHPDRVGPEKRKLIWKGGPQPATTIALVATDAVLTKGQAKRLAIASHAGLARGPALLSRPVRRRRDLRGRHGPPAAAGRGVGVHGAHGACSRLPDPRHRARRLRGDSPALSRRAAGLA